MLIRPNAFWQWAFSDFLSNTLRGVLAEYIVAQAVGGVSHGRVEWDAFDLLTKTGVKIEVKSSAYLQSWAQQRHSLIRFDIGAKKSWDATTQTSSLEPARAADVYVFCVFFTTDREQANPLDLNQWFFLLCSTSVLNERFPHQKGISLAALEAIPLHRLTFQQLSMALQKTLPRPST